MCCASTMNACKVHDQSSVTLSNVSILLTFTVKLCM